MWQKEKLIRPITPDDYCIWFKKFMRRLRKCLKETTKDIIVMTHFAPSIKSISEKYLKGNVYINASYASNLEKFITDNPRIKYWFHGHIHDSIEYEIGQCKVIAEPYGYHTSKEQILSPRKWYGRIIEL